MANNDKIVNLTTQMTAQEDSALETYLAQLLAARQPLLLAYQRKEITAEEYEQAAGMSVVETLTQQFAQEHRRQLRQMYDRVKAGYITEAECEAITGEPYDPNAIKALKAFDGILSSLGIELTEDGKYVVKAEAEQGE